MRYGALTIQEKTAKNIFFDSNLEEFLGINRKFQFITTVKRLNSPSTYFVHCNLVDKKQNLLNGEPSSVLARFDIKGEAYEKVYYQMPQTHVLRDTSTGDYVNSLTISVRDERGELFDFNGFPLEFEIEII